MNEQNYELIIENGDKRVFAAAKARTVVIKKSRLAVDVSIIIPSFERRETVECVHHLIQSLTTSRRRAHLVVVDQSFTPSTSTFIKETLTSYKDDPALASIFYHYDASLTIGTAKNMGATLLERHFGIAAMGKLLVFVDSDIYTPTETFDTLLQASSVHPTVTAFGFPSVWVQDDTSLAIMLRQSEYSLTQPYNKPEAILVQQGAAIEDSALLEVSAIHGCLFAVRTDVFMTKGKFHPFFGMHGEHVELCARLRDYGHRLAYIMNIRLLHDDRKTLHHSIMRNMPHREKFLLATLVAMMARNRVGQNRQKEETFTHIVADKWLSNIGVHESQREYLLEILLSLGSLLQQWHKEISEFLARAETIIASSFVEQNIKQHLTGMIEHIGKNREILTGIVEPRPRQPLYRL